jgi:hypothetical protein
MLRGLSGAMSIEELAAKYAGAYDSDFEMPKDDSEDEEEDSDDEDEEEDDEEEDDEEEDEDADSDGKLVSFLMYFRGASFFFNIAILTSEIVCNVNIVFFLHQR